MDQEQASPPKVIISYSWTSEEHKQWVRELAERLSSDGVDVTLDVWEVKEGHDLYVYMERMVTDSEISKVLIVCDEKYTQKANERKGGVGAESLIISPEIYAKADQDKFIPVVTQFDEEGQAYLPAFLKGRVFVDMSNDEKAAKNYETLLRNIFNRPLYKRPLLGTAPSYILNEESVLSKTRYKLLAVREAILGNKSNSKGIIIDYLRSYVAALEDFKFATDEYHEPFRETVLSSIHNFLPYRDEFIEFIILVSLHVDNPEIYESIFSFFEELLQFKDPPPGLGGYDHIRDNYRFILRELFLYLIAALIKNGKYSVADMFMSREYFLSSGARADAGQYYFKFSRYCTDAYSIEADGHTGRTGTTAKLLRERATNKEITFNLLMQSDLVLFLRSLLHRTGPDDWFWIPKTLVHAEYHGAFDLFARAESRRHFESLKVLLKIDNKEELVSSFEEAVREGIFGELRLKSATIRRLINLDNLDTRP